MSGQMTTNEVRLETFNFLTAKGKVRNRSPIMYHDLLTDKVSFSCGELKNNYGKKNLLTEGVF